MAWARRRRRGRPDYPVESWHDSSTGGWLQRWRFTCRSPFGSEAPPPSRARSFCGGSTQGRRPRGAACADVSACQQRARSGGRKGEKHDDPLDESEDEEVVQAAGAGPAGSEDPVKQAVVQIRQVLKAIHRERERKSDLEHLLDGPEGPGGDGLTASSSETRSKTAAYLKLRGALRSSPEQISSSIESLMLEDFVGAQTGPHQDERKLAARVGWNTAPTSSPTRGRSGKGGLWPPSST